MLKTVLWAIVGILATVTMARFLRGLGATTALSDSTPWGFWIAFDVMAGVALAAGGFVLAATVYIFGREKYRSFARPAILTAFLGYIAVAVGLMYDLGLPWHIWHPIVYPQYHSVLFEVAACVILYLTVLFFEFGPVILEHPVFHRPVFRKIHQILKKIAIPLVITGIVLSTLHQSSLGSLFLIAPYRLHPLWYSPIIWVLFFISAVGLGLMMVTAESFFSAWFFGHKLKMNFLSGLGKAASVVLLFYFGVRLADIAGRGLLAMAFDGSWQSILFLLELSISAIIPAGMLLFKKIRLSPVGLAACSGMTILGMIGYRFDVCIVAFSRPEGMSYFPSWMEVAVSVGIVAIAMLVFIFFVEKLKVYPEDEEEDHDGKMKEEAHFDPATMRNLMPKSLATPRRYSLAFIGSAALAIAFLPLDSLFGEQYTKTPVSKTTTIEGWQKKRSNKFGHELYLIDAKPDVAPDGEQLNLLMIDGNRDGRLVLFPHDRHSETLGQKDSCRQCHHQNLPFDKNTSCYECHSEMYTTTDIFDHSSHIQKLGGNQGCVRCHQDQSEIKARNTSLACAECHTSMVVQDTFIKLPKKEMRGFAVGYMDAMHGMCITCHQQKIEKESHKYGSNFADCTNCHRDIDASQLHEVEPYAIMRSPHEKLIESRGTVERHAGN